MLGDVLLAVHGVTITRRGFDSVEGSQELGGKGTLHLLAVSIAAGGDEESFVTSENSVTEKAHQLETGQSP